MAPGNKTFTLLLHNVPVGSFLLRRFFLPFLSGLLLIAAPARADVDTDRYQPVSLQSLALYGVQAQIFSLEEDDYFIDYLRLSECEIYNMIKDNPFRQQELRTALLEKLANTEIPPPLFIYKDVTVNVAGYNFETQSLDMDRSSRMQRVGHIGLIDERKNDICGGTPYQLRNPLPSIFNLKLAFPVSLMRIPLQKRFAETVMKHLDESKFGSQPMLYVRLYFQVEPLEADDTDRRTSSRFNQTTFHGQLNMINIFLDHEHKILIKRLNYAENY